MDDKEKIIETLRDDVVKLVKQANEDGLGIPAIVYELSFLIAHMCLVATRGHSVGVGPVLDGAIDAIKTNAVESSPEEDEEKEECNGSKES